MFLEAEPDLVVAGEAVDGEQAVLLIRAGPPDVVLTDGRMPGVDGIGATRRILRGGEHPAVRVIVLTTFDMDGYVYDALRAEPRASSSRTCTSTAPRPDRRPPRSMP